jgi:hypothetical protein
MNRFNTGEYSKFKNSLIASYLAVSRVSQALFRFNLSPVKMFPSKIVRDRSFLPLLNIVVFH